ncbi:MAG: ATP-binding protein [Rhodothermaceae bacterium]
MKKIIILCLLIFTSGFAQDLKLRKYTMSDGLPTNDIPGIVQDSLGYIWVTSSRGLLKYDGIKWENNDSEFNIEGLNFIKIMKDNRGDLWVYQSETKNQLIRLTKKNPIVYDFDKLKLFKKGERLNFAKVIYHNNKMLITISTNMRRVFTLTNGRWNLQNIVGISGGITGIEFAFGKFWIATSKEVLEQQQDQFVKSKISSKISDIKLIKTKKIKGKETLLFLTNKMLCGFDGKRFEVINKNINLYLLKGVPTIYYLDVCQTGDIFLGNDTKFFVINSEGKIVQKYLAIKELQGSGGTDLFIDKENIIWLATKRGVLKIIRSPFSGLKNYHRINTEEVASLYKARDGRIVIGQNGRINVYKNDKLKTYPFEGDSVINKTTTRVMDIKEDSSGMIWFAVNQYGIGRIDKGKIKWIKSKDYLNFSGIVIKENDEKLIGTTSGLYRLNGNDLEKVPNREIFVRRIKLLSDSSYVICSGVDGVYFSDAKDSLINFKCNDKALNSTYDILKISEKIFWVATKAGLVEINTQLKTYKKILNDEISEELYNVNEDLSGAMWLGSNNGYLRFSNNSIMKFNTAVGLAGNEANRTAFIIDDSKNLWLGTDGGLSILDSRFFENEYPKPVCLISSVVLNGKKFESVPDEVVLPDNFKLEIKYSGLSFIDEEHHTYKLKLYDENKKLIFEKKTERTDLELFALQPGEYNLMIWCINPLSIKNEIPARIKIIAKGDFYKSNWFYLILIAASSFLAYLSYYLIGQRRYAKRLEMEVEKKTSELLTEMENKNKIAEKLAKSEEKYRGLVDHSVIGIFQIDLNGKFVTVNNSLMDLLGYDKTGEVNIMQNISEVIINEEGSENFIESTLRDKFLIAKKYTIRRIDESVVRVRCNARLVDEGEDKIFIEGTFEDITQSVLAENALIMAKQKAEHSEKIKTEFLAQMSHEIRTPVNVILSFSQLLKEEIQESVSEEHKEFFQGMDKAGRRIIRTIDLLLNVSELQTGGYDYKPKKLDLLEDIMKPLVIEYKSLAKENHLELKLECEPEIFLLGDEYTVTQIFANLVDNAIKYTNKGSVEITVEVKNNITVFVKDSGIGISEEYLPELFSPFSQEEQGYTRKYEGNGLGLTLVKKYCELNNAEIKVESKKGSGTTIIVVFKN